MEDNLIEEGVELMTVGMGVVFAFLILLVVFMSLSGAFFTRFARWFSDPPEPPAQPSRPVAQAKAKIAVALAAARRHRDGS